MADKNLVLTLAKVIVATAWVDGEISPAEIASLKDLIFRLAQVNVDNGRPITTEEWARLEMYIESPVGDAERARLVQELQAILASPADKALAITALEELIRADGQVTDSEQTVTAEIKEAINNVQTGGLGRLPSMVRQAIQRRSAAVAQAPNREEDFAEYVKNKIFYLVRQRMQQEEQVLDIPDDTLRKLSLAGGLMARVARADQQVAMAESNIVIGALQANWHIDLVAATLVAEVALSDVCKDLDYYRMARDFFNITTDEERRHFLHALFAVAAAHEGVSADESENIRRMARSLHIRQSTFMHAKAQFAE